MVDKQCIFVVDEIQIQPMEIILYTYCILNFKVLTGGLNIDVCV